MEAASPSPAGVSRERMGSCPPGAQLQPFQNPAQGKQSQMRGGLKAAAFKVKGNHTVEAPAKMTKKEKERKET